MGAGDYSFAASSRFIVRVIQDISDVLMARFKIERTKARRRGEENLAQAKRNFDVHRDDPKQTTRRQVRSDRRREISARNLTTNRGARAIMGGPAI